MTPSARAAALIATRMSRCRRISLGAARRDGPVGEDDVHEHVVEEVALRLDDLLRRRLGRADAHGLAHAAEHAIERAPLLRAAREVEAAEDGRALEGVDRERGRDELREVPLDARELERELVDLLARLAVPLAWPGASARGRGSACARTSNSSSKILPGFGLVHVELERGAPGLRRGRSCACRRRTR